MSSRRTPSGSGSRVVGGLGVVGHNGSSAVLRGWSFTRQPRGGHSEFPCAGWTGAVRSRRSAIDVAVDRHGRPGQPCACCARWSPPRPEGHHGAPGGAVDEARIGTVVAVDTERPPVGGVEFRLADPGRPRAWWRRSRESTPRHTSRRAPTSHATWPSAPGRAASATCASPRRSSPPPRPRVSATSWSSPARRPIGAHADNPVPLEDDAPLRAPSDEGQVGDLMDVEQLIAVARDVHPGLAITAVRPAALVGDGVDTVITRHFEAPRLLTLRGAEPGLAVLPRRRPRLGRGARRGAGRRGRGLGRRARATSRRPTSNDSPGCAGSSSAWGPRWELRTASTALGCCRHPPATWPSWPFPGQSLPARCWVAAGCRSMTTRPASGCSWTRSGARTRWRPAAWTARMPLSGRPVPRWPWWARQQSCGDAAGRVRSA